MVVRYAVQTLTTRTLPRSRPCARRLSTLQKGQTVIGWRAVYKLQSIIYERVDPENPNTHEPRRVWKAERQSDGAIVVVKPVIPFHLEHVVRAQEAIGSSSYIRFPIDRGADLDVLIFEHFRTDLLAFGHKALPRPQTKLVLRDILRGLAQCHAAGWAHADLKANNILLNYQSSDDGSRQVSRVAIGDIEDAVPLKPGQAIHGKVGNIYWRGPEAHAAGDVGLSNDIWSFGVIVYFMLTQRIMFWYGELPNGAIPEVATLSMMLSFFGPLPPGLMKDIPDLPFSVVLPEMEGDFGPEHPRVPFREWEGAAMLSDADQAFILDILQLDPAARPSAATLLDHPWFKES